MSELFPQQAPDFSDPFGLLKACHERILKSCELLLAVCDKLDQGEPDSETVQAAGQIHRYFSTAGQHHHQDEEQELFPLINHVSLKLATTIHELKQDHQKIDELWQQLAPQLMRLRSVEDTVAFRQLAEALATAYRDHIEKENEDLLDVAVHILSSKQQKKLGEAMAKRRGVTVYLK